MLAGVLYGAITSDAIGTPAFGSDETHLREIYTELLERIGADELGRRIQHGRRLERRLITDAALTAIRKARAHA